MSEELTQEPGLNAIEAAGPTRRQRGRPRGLVSVVSDVATQTAQIAITVLSEKGRRISRARVNLIVTPLGLDSLTQALTTLAGIIEAGMPFNTTLDLGAGVTLTATANGEG